MKSILLSKPAQEADASQENEDKVEEASQETEKDKSEEAVEETSDAPGDWYI